MVLSLSEREESAGLDLGRLAWGGGAARRHRGQYRSHTQGQALLQKPPAIYCVHLSLAAFEAAHCTIPASG
jgi:hypothetical protein